VNPTQPPLWYSEGKREEPLIKDWAIKSEDVRHDSNTTLNISKLRMEIDLISEKQVLQVNKESIIKIIRDRI
jgi:hypothetical protein